MIKAQTPRNTPWVVQSEFETTIVDSLDNELAQVFAPGTQEQLEIGRLMAAAPELLAACTTVAEDCRMALSGEWDKSNEGFQASLELLESVIAKASGGADVSPS
jgi:hypothetical protein